MSPLITTYDPFYRLTAADYDDGTFFYYTYDSVGNRLIQETLAGTNNYVYDIANRLIEVDGVTYTWDANGNLLNDGMRTYSYNHTNRLTGVSQGGDAYTFAYNGLGDRLQQVVNGDPTAYTLDLNTGLTQVLADGENTYLYGNGRIGEEQAGGWQYYMGDALGSVCQLADNNSTVTRAQRYKPFGSLADFAGDQESWVGYTGEWADGSGLIHLRARYLDSETGRFFTPDPWSGSVLQLMSYNPYLYAYNNPVLYTDPSGRISQSESFIAEQLIKRLYSIYKVRIRKDWGLLTYEDLMNSPSFYLNPSTFSCKWQKGNWRSLDELRWTEEAIYKVTIMLGGPHKFRQAMGPSIRITRWNSDGGSFAPPGARYILGNVVLTNPTFDRYASYARYIIAHELGHVWDYNTGRQLSKGLMIALKTWMCDENGECRWHAYAKYVDPDTLEIGSEPPPGSDPNCWGHECSVIPYAATYGWESRDKPLQKIFAYFGWWPGIEDWAESFASYVYPNYWSNPSRKRSRISRTGLVIGGTRYEYIKNQIQGLP